MRTLKPRRDLDSLKDFLAYSYVKGKMFDDWVDISPRSNGYNSGDLLRQPAYIIEDIIRYWIKSETLLEASAYDDATNYVEFNGSTGNLLNSTDDFYNGAYLVNLKQGWIKEITDYDGTNKRVYVSSLTAAEMVTSLQFFIFNIQPNINTSSFDTVGNATNGTRNRWVFDRSLIDIENSSEILRSLAFESFTLLTKDYKDYKLTTLNDNASVGTLTTPMFRQNPRIPDIEVSYSSLQNVYNSFEVNFDYDYAKKIFKKRHFVNSVGSSDSTNLGTSYQTACRNAEINHKVNNKFVYDALWIKDNTTAYKFVQSLVDYFTIRKLKIKWVGNIKDHLKYQRGDIVLVNYPSMIPTGKNNSTKFMVIGKTIYPFHKQGRVELRLLEMV
jgi:hypothetical protein